MSATLLTIDDSLRRAIARLAPMSESPRLDAELLLGHVLKIGRAALITRANEVLSEVAAACYSLLIEQRRAGLPIAYLTGHREFWSLDFEVSPAVLVPRPETETLVEAALECLPREVAGTVLDLGTGSGAIAVALALERPRARVIATERSSAALEVARRNAARLAPGRIDIRAGSWFEPVAGERFELVVSNPPYVAARDPALATLAAEPRDALVAGPTGLEALAALAAGAPTHLRPGGALVLEHGATQSNAVVQLLEQHGFQSIRTHRDRAGHARVAVGILPSSQQDTHHDSL